MKKGILLALTVVLSLYSQDSLSLESIAERVLADSPVIDSVASDWILTDTTIDIDSVNLEEIAVDSVEVDTTVADVTDSIIVEDTTIEADSVDTLVLVDSLGTAIFEDLTSEDTTLITNNTSDTDDDTTVSSGTILIDSVDAVTSASPMLFESPIGIVLVILIIVAIIAAIVMKLKSGKSSNKFLTQTRISIMDREVQIICGHIEEKFAQKDLTAQTVCEAVSTGVSFAEGLFSKELDMTIDEFIAHVRIHQAVDMINRGFCGELPQLMDQCGYEIESQFEADFTDITGVEVKKLLKDVE